MSNRQLFFALWPTDRQRDRLRDIISPMAKLVEGTAIYRGSWHVTLAHIGEFAEERIPELQLATSAISFEPFRLRFDRLEYWPRQKVAVLAAAMVPPELQQLVDSLTAVLNKLGVTTESFAYRPHITVVIRARACETQRLAQPGVIEWSDFDLIESSLRSGNVTYRPLKQ